MQYYNSFGLAQQLFKKKVDVSVNIMNPFEKRMSYTNTSSDATFYEYRNSSYIIRRVFLNVNYRFGKMQTQVKKARRTVTNDDKMEGGGASAGPGGGQ